MGNPQEHKKQYLHYTSRTYTVPLVRKEHGRLRIEIFYFIMGPTTIDGFIPIHCGLKFNYYHLLWDPLLWTSSHNYMKSKTFHDKLPLYFPAHSDICTPARCLDACAS
jgi:hypothetical protein